MNIPQNANGQATMANSEPIVIASNQTAVPVSATDLDIRNLTNTDVVTAELSATDNAVLDAIEADTTIIADATKLEDSGHTTGDRGMAILAVRNEGHDDFSGTDKDYIPIAVDATGDVYTTIRHSLPAGSALIGKVGIDQTTPGTTNKVTVGADVVHTIIDSGAVTTSGTVTEANSAAIKTSVELIDNAVDGTGFNISKVNGEAIDVGAGTEAAAIRVTLPTDGTGRVTAISGTAANMKVEATIAGSQTIAVTNATAANLKVDLSGTAANSTAVKVNVASGGIASGAITAGNTSIATTEDTASAGGEHLIKNGVVRKDTPVANAEVDTDGDYAKMIADNFGLLWVDPQGNVAHDSVDAGRPIKVGGRASTTPVTAVSANDRVDAFFDVQGRQVVTAKALTGTLSNVNGSASNVTLLAANTARLGATIWNDSSAILYVKLGATASATSCTVKMIADSYYEVPFGYYGIIDGIWASATGVARVTEIS